MAIKFAWLIHRIVTTAPTGRELYHLQFLFQAASPELHCIVTSSEMAREGHVFFTEHLPTLYTLFLVFHSDLSSSFPN